MVNWLIGETVPPSPFPLFTCCVTFSIHSMYTGFNKVTQPLTNESKCLCVYFFIIYQINPVYMLRDFLQMKEKTKEQAIK